MCVYTHKKVLYYVYIFRKYNLLSQKIRDSSHVQFSTVVRILYRMDIAV